MKILTDFIKSLFQSRLAIILIAINLCFFLYGESKFFNFNPEHIHSDSCLVAIQSQFITEHSYTLTAGFFKLLNLPAFFMMSISMDLLGKFFSPICFATNYRVEIIFLTLLIALQWFLLGNIFTRLLNNSYKSS